MCALQLAAAGALAAGAISQSELAATVAVMRARNNRQVTPTLFGAVGRRPG